MNKVYYTWQDINLCVSLIARNISISNWRPDIIVGLTRGGLIPATMLSHYFNVPMIAVNFSTRDFEKDLKVDLDEYKGKKVLIVDDINDTGKTISEIRNKFVGIDVKVAVIVDKLSSEVEVDFKGDEIDNTLVDTWVDFPWEFWYGA